MGIQHRVREWVARQVKGIGSLVSASVVVLGVLLFALFSLGVSSGALPSVDGAADAVSTDAADAFDALQKQLPDLYIKAVADRPVALTAEIEVRGWRDREQRIMEAQVSKVRPKVVVGSVGKQPSAFPEGQISEQLLGKRILASVSEAAAQVLPESGAAEVVMIVTPSGETATVIIDEVLVPAPRAAARLGATGPSVAESPQATVNGSAQSPGAPVEITASSARVTSLSRYWGAPGTLVTMYGTGFGSSAGASWVTCGGAKAKVKSWSNTEIAFWVPSKMTKQGYVGVNKNRVNSNGMYFSPFNPPAIASISPREGAPGTVVTIKGRYFGSKQADGWVSFAGSAAQVVSWSDSAIRVVVPRDAASGYVGIVAHGMTSNGVLYAPLGAPLVQSVSAKVLIPGRTVAIRGRSFGVRQGVVVIGGVSVPSTSWTATEVRFTVPVDIKSGYVGVVRADSMTSNGVWCSYAPRVDSLSRWWAPSGSQVEIRGVGFGATQDERTAFIGGKEVTVVDWSDTQVTVEIPPSVSSGYMGIGTRGACSNGIWLVVETQARIDSVSPRLVAPGDHITITGSGFGPQPTGTNSSSKATIGGTTCEIDSWSDDTIVAVVPETARLSYVGVIKQKVASNGVWIVVQDGN